MNAQRTFLNSLNSDIQLNVLFVRLVSVLKSTPHPNNTVPPTPSYAILVIRQVSNPCVMSESTPQSYTIQKAAEEIFRTVLLENDRLGLSEDVKAAATRTTFSQSAIPQPYIPTSLKFSESSSALWALLATYGNAITKKRYALH